MRCVRVLRRESSFHFGNVLKRATGEAYVYKVWDKARSEESIVSLET